MPNFKVTEPVKKKEPEKENAPQNLSEALMKAIFNPPSSTSFKKNFTPQQPAGLLISESANNKLFEFSTPIAPFGVGNRTIRFMLPEQLHTIFRTVSNRGGPVYVPLPIKRHNAELMLAVESLLSGGDEEEVRKTLKEMTMKFESGSQSLDLPYEYLAGRVKPVVEKDDDEEDDEEASSKKKKATKKKKVSSSEEESESEEETEKKKKGKASSESKLKQANDILLNQMNELREDMEKMKIDQLKNAKKPPPKRPNTEGCNDDPMVQGAIPKGYAPGQAKAGAAKAKGKAKAKAGGPLPGIPSTRGKTKLQRNHTGDHHEAKVDSASDEDLNE